MLRSCFLSSFVEFHSAVSEEKLKMSQPIRGQGRHFVFPIGPKNTNLVEDIEILLPVKFCSVVSEEKSKMSQPIRGQGGHFVFSNRVEKHKLGRGCWGLASFKVSLKSVERFQRRSQKCPGHTLMLKCKKTGVYGVELSSIYGLHTLGIPSSMAGQNIAKWCKTTTFYH